MGKQEKYLNFVVDDLISKTKTMLSLNGGDIIVYPPWLNHGYLYNTSMGFFNKYENYVETHYGLQENTPVKHILDKFGSTEGESTYCWYRYTLKLRELRDDMVSKNRNESLNESISEKRLKLVNAIVSDMIYKTKIVTHPDPDHDAMWLSLPMKIKFNSDNRTYFFGKIILVWKFFDYVDDLYHPVNLCDELKELFPINDEECMEVWELYTNQLRYLVNEELEKEGYGIRV